MFNSLESVNRTISHVCILPLVVKNTLRVWGINGKDSCRSSIATIMDTSVVDLTILRLTGAARFLSRHSNGEYFYSHIRTIHSRRQQRCESHLVTPPGGHLIG